MTQLRTTRALLAEGLADFEIARMVRTNELERVRRGAYASPLGPTVPAIGAERERHLRLIEATLPWCAPDSVISHRSAAVLWGLPVAVMPERVELTRRPGAKGHDRRCVHLRVAQLDASEVTELDGHQITTRARTVVDLARSWPLLASVVTGDAALRAGLSYGELQHCLLLARSRPGVRQARRACDFFDGLSESGGESISRVRLVSAGIPRPTLQHEVFDASGELIARCDFFWREFRTVGEFDGKVKYQKLLRPGQDANEVVWSEKQREDAIRETGLEMVRWTWDDLRRMGQLVERLQRAFARGLR